MTKKLTNNELVDMAYEAMEFSYSPYSGFSVGAALLTEEGTVYKGCNIENSSYGGTVCAERTAIFKAVSEGHKSFKKLAIVSKTHKETFPCGICRQVMSEFMDDDAVIILDKGNGESTEYSLSELLPHSFKL